MSRNFYIGFLVIIIAGLAYLFLFRAQTPSAEMVAQSEIREIPIAQFGGVSLKIEYATSTVAREFGLGGRAEIPSDFGMLFIFPTDDLYGFWMNDMLVPVDIFWLDAQGQVVSIEENVDPSTYPNVFYPTAPARYVLETVAGFTQAHSITVGTPFVLKNIPSVTE